MFQSDDVLIDKNKPIESPPRVKQVREFKRFWKLSMKIGKKGTKHIRSLDSLLFLCINYGINIENAIDRCTHS
jgi:hypothetical protein